MCADPKYSRNVIEWDEADLPPKCHKGDRAAWFYTANYSKLEWQVFTQEGKPLAGHDDGVIGKLSVRPTFKPKADKLKGGSAFVEVDDDWIVGFNQGEFGASPY